MTTVTEWIHVGILHNLSFYWRELPYGGGLALELVTAQHENGKQTTRRITSTRLILTAMSTSLGIIRRGGSLDITTLTKDTYWQYGWEPDMIPLRNAMVKAAQEQPTREVDWLGFQAWRRGQHAQ